MGQPGFFELENRYAGLDAHGDPLVAINAAVPFELFRVKLKTALIKGGLRRSLVSTARESHTWIACDCLGAERPPLLMSAAYLSLQETYCLRRLTSRPGHVIQAARFICRKGSRSCRAYEQDNQQVFA